MIRGTVLENTLLAPRLTKQDKLFKSGVRAEKIVIERFDMKDDGRLGGVRSRIFQFNKPLFSDDPVEIAITTEECWNILVITGKINIFWYETNTDIETDGVCPSCTLTDIYYWPLTYEIARLNMRKGEKLPDDSIFWKYFRKEYFLRYN